MVEHPGIVLLSSNIVLLVLQSFILLLICVWLYFLIDFLKLLLV